MIAAVPVVIAKLGLAGYGTWETIQALSASTTLLIGPLTGTLLWRASMAHGANDQIAMSRTTGIGLTFSGLLLASAFPVFLVAHSLARMVHVPSDLISEFIYVMPSVLVLTIAGGVVESFGVVVDGSQRLGYSSMIRTMGQSVRYIVAIVFLNLGHGLSSLLFGFAISILVMVTGMAILAHRLCPLVRPVPVIPTREEWNSGRKYASLLMVGYVSAALRDQTDKLAFAFFASAIWVGYYAIASRLAALVMEINTFVYNPTIAAAGAMIARGERDRIAGLYRTLMAWVPMLSGMILVIIVGMHRPLMYLWLGRIVPQAIPLLLMLVLANGFVVALTGSGTSLCRGIGRVEIETAYVVFNLILNAVFTVILIKLIGPFGSAIASVGSWTLGSLYFVWHLHRSVSLPVKATVKAVGIYCVAASTGIFTMLVANAVVGSPTSRKLSMEELLIGAASSLACYVLVLRLLRLQPEQAGSYCRRLFKSVASMRQAQLSNEVAPR
jgi:O-antigen/teichoic acid export membrane protein